VRRECKHECTLLGGEQKCDPAELELKLVDSAKILRFLPMLVRETPTAYKHLLQYTPEKDWPASKWIDPNPGLSFDCSAAVEGERCEMSGRVFTPKKPEVLAWPVDQKALDRAWTSAWPNNERLAAADPRNPKDRASGVT
jgi:hypothetical protein